MSENDKPGGKPAVKAKLPSAREISRSEFKPHGIGGRSRTRPSAMTAAKAKRRRRLITAVVVTAVVAATGIGTFIATRPEPTIKVAGAFGTRPKITIPDDLAPKPTLQKTVLVTGTGTKVGKNDLLLVNIESRIWSSKGKSKPLDSTFTGNRPVPLQLGQSLLSGLQKSLPGTPAGSRLLLQVPPKEGLGKQGNPQNNIKGTDTLVFVVDVVSAFNNASAASGIERKLDDADLPKAARGEAGKEPSDLKMPKTDPPGKLVSKTLIEGSGPVVTDGQTVVAQYKGQLWRNGKVFDASWKNGQLFTFELGREGAIKGFSTGVKGHKVGSRIMLVIPPKDGYGKQGNGEIKGTDTMVFTIDILGAA